MLLRKSSLRVRAPPRTFPSRQAAHSSGLLDHFFWNISFAPGFDGLRLMESIRPRCGGIRSESMCLLLMGEKKKKGGWGEAKTVARCFCEGLMEAEPRHDSKEGAHELS